MVNLESLRDIVQWKSPFMSAIIGAGTGFGAQASGLVPGGNQFVFIALCGVAGAFFGNLHRIIGAFVTKSVSDREFVGKETRTLIRDLRKDKSDLERIMALQVAARHRIQGEYQAALFHIQLRDQLLKDADCLKAPPFTPVDINDLIIGMDKEIKAIKNGNGRAMMDD